MLELQNKLDFAKQEVEKTKIQNNKLIHKEQDETVKFLINQGFNHLNNEFKMLKFSLVKGLTLVIFVVKSNVRGLSFW